MSDTAQTGWLAALERAGRTAENIILVLMLLAMLGVAVTQIVMRNVFSGGFVWSDEFLRLTVLWVALLGSMAAARDHRHLRIDMLSRYLSASVSRWTDLVVELFTTGVCTVLAYYSYLFVAETREYEDLAFGDQPLWWFQAILPIGFAVIALRYAGWSLRRITGSAPPRAGL